MVFPTAKRLHLEWFSIFCYTATKTAPKPPLLYGCHAIPTALCTFPRGVHSDAHHAAQLNGKWSYILYYLSCLTVLCSSPRGVLSGAHHALD